MCLSFSKQPSGATTASLRLFRLLLEPIGGASAWWVRYCVLVIRYREFALHRSAASIVVLSWYNKQFFPILSLPWMKRCIVGVCQPDACAGSCPSQARTPTIRLPSMESLAKAPSDYISVLRRLVRDAKLHTSPNRPRSLVSGCPTRPVRRTRWNATSSSACPSRSGPPPWLPNA